MNGCGTGVQSTENLGYAYDTAWNLSTRTNYGVSQAFAVNVKNELTNAVGLARNYDANGNLTNRVYDATGSKTYVYLYDDENHLIEMRTDEYYTPSGSRFRTLWAYDGLGRARVRTDYRVGTTNHTNHTNERERSSRSVGVPVGSAGRDAAWPKYEGVHSCDSRDSWLSIVVYFGDGMRVIQERDASNIPAVVYTRGNDLSGSLEGAGGIGGLLGRSHGYSSGSWSTHNHYHADSNGNVTYLVN